MKQFTLILTFLVILLISNSYGQKANSKSAYLDAMKLKKILVENKDKISEIDYEKKIIYIRDSSASAKFNDILKNYGTATSRTKNPYLFKTYFDRKPDTIEGSRGVASFLKADNFDAERRYERPTPTSLSWEASAINGLANFMAGRFKEEVLHMAINQMFNQIGSEDEKNKARRELVAATFPRTFNRINSYKRGENSFYTADLMIFRQLAQLDIEELPKNIIDHAEYVFPEMDNINNLKDLLYLGNHLVEYSKQALPIDQLISKLARAKYSSTRNRDKDTTSNSESSMVQEALGLLDIITQAIVNEEGSAQHWVDLEDFDYVENDQQNLDALETTLFYGLFYQDLQNNKLFKSIAKEEIKDTKTLEGKKKLAEKMQGLTSFINRLNNAFNFADNKSFNFSLTSDKMIYLREIGEALGSFLESVDKATNLSESLSKSGTTKDISVDNLNKKGISEIISGYLNIVETTLTQDYQRLVPLFVVEFEPLMSENQKALRTLSFFSGLALVETANDMEDLLRSYALPIGSASIKRTSKFNMSVNAYVGFTGGWETAYGTNRELTSSNIGLAVPIGLSMTFYRYFTTFVSVIDLGSLVNQRLNNDIAYYSNVKFEHFFTPGLGLYFNIPKVPLTIGAHLNYIPNLRNIEYSNGNAIITEENRSVTRLNFSILMDIPLFNIYNKEREF